MSSKASGPAPAGTVGADEDAPVQPKAAAGEQAPTPSGTPAAQPLVGPKASGAEAPEAPRQENAPEETSSADEATMTDSPGARIICAIRTVLALHFQKGSRRARGAMACEIAWFDRWRQEATEDSQPVDSTEMMIMEQMIGAAGKGYDLVYNINVRRAGLGEYSVIYRNLKAAASAADPKGGL